MCFGHAALVHDVFNGQLRTFVVRFKPDVDPTRVEENHPGKIEPIVWLAPKDSALGITLNFVSPPSFK